MHVLILCILVEFSRQYTLCLVMAFESDYLTRLSSVVLLNYIPSLQRLKKNTLHLFLKTFLLCLHFLSLHRFIKINLSHVKFSSFIMFILHTVYSEIATTVATVKQHNFINIYV